MHPHHTRPQVFAKNTRDSDDLAEKTPVGLGRTPFVANGQWSRLHRLSQAVPADEVAALTGLAPDEIDLIPLRAAREAAADAAAEAVALARREREREPGEPPSTRFDNPHAG
jgi:hypothetical protein